MDGGFASRIFEHDPQICSTTGLTDEEFSWLRAQDPAALSADPGGKRRAQIVGNIASEFRLSLSAASRSSRNAGEPDPAWLDHFPGSAEFHGAVLGGDRLPLAFALFALHDARSKGHAELVPVIELELALARLRREAAGGRLGALASHHLPHPPGNDRSAERGAFGFRYGTKSRSGHAVAFAPGPHRRSPFGHTRVVRDTSNQSRKRPSSSAPIRFPHGTARGGLALRLRYRCSPPAGPGSDGTARTARGRATETFPDRTDDQSTIRICPRAGCRTGGSGTLSHRLSR